MFTFVKNLYIMYILYSQGVQFMFKKIGIVLICVAMAATVFAGCSKKILTTKRQAADLRTAHRNSALKKMKTATQLQLNMTATKLML